MAEENIQQTEVERPVPKPKAKMIEAFYMVPKSGGFQARKLIIEEGVVLDDSAFGDPHAWDQVLAEVEHELSKPFQ